MGGLVELAKDVGGAQHDVRLAIARLHLVARVLEVHNLVTLRQLPPKSKTTKTMSERMTIHAAQTGRRSFVPNPDTFARNPSSIQTHTSGLQQ